MLQVVDGDDGSAYAWLAIGRFDPPVLKVPAADPSQIAKRQKAAGELAGALQVASLEHRMTKLMLAPETDLDAKAALAQAIVANKRNDFLSALAAILPDPGVPASLRESITAAIAGDNSPQAVADEALRSVSHRLQVKLAQALSGSATGAEHLLTSAPPALLLERSVKEKILAAKIPNAGERIDKLTQGFSPPNEALQKLVEKRHKKFDPAKARAVDGEAVFTKTAPYAIRWTAKADSSARSSMALVAAAWNAFAKTSSIPIAT